MRSLTAAYVTALHHARNRFGPECADEKAAQLAACMNSELSRPRTMLRYHETLLFMAAHPESAAQARQVDSELRRIQARASSFFATDTGADVLAGSGLAGDVVEANFSIALIQWLADTYGDQVELAWQDGSVGAGLNDLLALAMLPPERDGRMNTRFDMQTWIRNTTGRDSTELRDLRWVLGSIRSLIPDGELRDVVAEGVDLSVRWTLGAPGPTRTLTRFPKRRIFMQRSNSMRTFDVDRLLRKPLPEPVRLTKAATQELIDTARSTLTVRQREADPITYANPREVTLFSLDRGIDIALFGLEPNRRLPIESYFGYIAARNRVPIAYGGAWIMDHRAEVGVHLFDTFRGGESAYMFGQVLRTYRDHYQVTRFRVDPFQFGADNPDAIRSGAFWFYYRFGFRPLDAKLRQLATDEWQAIRRARAYRTSHKVLRHFVESPLVLDFDTGRANAYHADPTRLGVAVADAVRNRFGTDRDAAQQWAVRRVTRLLSASDRKRWTDEERRAFERLSPLIAVLPGLENWSVADRRSLAAIMRAKGGPRERDYVSRIQQHARLRAAFAALEDSVDWSALPE